MSVMLQVKWDQSFHQMLYIMSDNKKNGLATSQGLTIQISVFLCKNKVSPGRCLKGAYAMAGAGMSVKGANYRPTDKIMQILTQIGCN